MRFHKWLNPMALIHATIYCGITLSEKQHGLTGAIVGIPTSRGEMI